MNDFLFLQASCYCFVLLSPIIFCWLLFYFFLIHCHIWSYQSKKSFQKQTDHQEHLVYLCVFPRFGVFSMIVYECFSTFISQTTLWSWVNNIISTYQLETVMHKENEWLLEATQEQWVQKWITAEVPKWPGFLMPTQVWSAMARLLHPWEKWSQRLMQHCFVPLGLLDMGVMGEEKYLLWDFQNNNNKRSVW